MTGSRSSRCLGLSLVLLWGCGETTSTRLEPTTDQVARSNRGMVVAAQPLATAAGVEMLERGGNAADAAVAAAFAVSVVEPSMNSIGGRTQILVRTSERDFHGIDATTQAPATYDPDTAPQAGYGYPTVGVPGAVAGLTPLLAEHGTLPLATVMEPAIQYAAEGFTLLPGESRSPGFGNRAARGIRGREAVLPQNPTDRRTRPASGSCRATWPWCCAASRPGAPRPSTGAKSRKPSPPTSKARAGT